MGSARVTTSPSGDGQDLWRRDQERLSELTVTYLSICLISQMDLLRPREEEFSQGARLV